MKRITTPELAKNFIEEQISALRTQIGNKKVLLALSGGVDSSVVAALLIKAIGKQLICVHVNHGLLRKGEPEQVVQVFRDEMKANLVYVDAANRFLDKLAASPSRRKKERLSERSLSVYSKRRQESLTELISLRRVQSILIFWKAVP